MHAFYRRKPRRYSVGETPHSLVKQASRSRSDELLASPLNPVRDERSTEVSLREQTIVRRARDSKIADAFRSAACPSLLVVNLCELGCATALPVAAHERTAETIPRRDLLLRGVWDVTATLRSSVKYSGASRCGARPQSARFSRSLAARCKRRSSTAARCARIRASVREPLPSSRASSLSSSRSAMCPNSQNSPPLMS
jgi:hypothetical protein